jgi:Shikimate kinase
MIIIVMGVAGAGKTTIGHLLAEQLRWEFADGDDYHPQANVEKIRKGIPLIDDDRQPWLQQLRTAIAVWQSQGRNVVLDCVSATKCDLFTCTGAWSLLHSACVRERAISPTIRFWPASLPTWKNRKTQFVSIFLKLGMRSLPKFERN